MANVVQCPQCSTRLQLPPLSKDGVCPHCRTHVTIAPVPGVPTVQPKLQQRSAAGATTVKPPVFVEPTGATVTQAVERLGFVAYLRQYFAATHWPAAFGICLGLLAIPIVSLLKPILEFRGMCIVLAGAFILSILSGIIYIVQRFAVFFFCGKRTVPDQATSWMARLTYGSLMFLIPMAPWVCAEYFGPPYGLMAAIAPDFRKEQARWFGLPIPEADQKESGTAASDNKVQETLDAMTTNMSTQPQPVASGNNKVQVTRDAATTETSTQPKSIASDNNTVQETHDIATKETSTQPQTESANPFVVVEESPPSTEQPKNKTPPTSNNTDDEDPFQVIKD